MDAILPYLLWAVVILIGVSLVAVALFGIRGIAYGKANMFTIASFLLPIVLFGILLLVQGDWIEAGVTTALIMFVVAGFGLLFTGARGAFT